MDFTFPSVSKEEWNAFFNTRINKCRKLSPTNPTRSPGVSPGPQRREAFCTDAWPEAGTSRGLGQCQGTPAGLRPHGLSQGVAGCCWVLLFRFLFSLVPMPRPFPRGGGKYLQRSPRTLRHPASIFSWDDATSQWRPCHCSNSYRRKKNLKKLLLQTGIKSEWVFRKDLVSYGEKLARYMS